LLACLALYLALALPQLHLPGLHNDEAVEGGLPAGQILDGQPITTFRGAGLAIAGRTWPLMVQDYIGAFNVYLPLPFLAAFGHTPFALRFYTVGLGALTLALAFGFARTLLGLRAALLSSLLLAVSPSFVFWQREGVFVTSITATLALALLWAGLAWLRTARLRWALAAGLLAGAGLYAKLLFLWVIGGAVGASLSLASLAWLASRRATSRPPSSTAPQLHRSLTPSLPLDPVIPNAPQPPGLGAAPVRVRTLSPRVVTLSALMALAGFALGLLPLVQYNLQTGGTFASLGANLGTSFYGVNNTDVLNNLRVRVAQLAEVVSGRDHLSFLGGSFHNPLWPWALGLSVLAIVTHALLTRRTGPRLWLLILFTLAVAQSAFTVSGLFATHFALLAPFWPMVLAAGLTLSWRGASRLSSGTTNATPPRRPWLIAGRLLLLVAFGLLWARDLTATIAYHQRLHRVGGTSSHTDAIYRLVSALQAHSGQPVFALDWGFSPQVNMLTRGAIVPLEIFGYSWEPDEGFVARLDEALAQPGALYLFHTEGDTVFPRRAQFNSAVAALGAQVETVAVIARLDTVPVIEIVRVAP
jgi:hypothetical protein